MSAMRTIVSETSEIQDYTSIEFRREGNEFEEPIEDDLERRELYLDDQLEEEEDFVIQERLLQSNATSTATTPSFTTTSAAPISTPPLTSSPTSTSGLSSYASACTVGTTVNPSRVSSACACLITATAATTTSTTTITADPTPTVTITVPGPTTTATTTTYASCAAPHYHRFQQFNHSVPASVARTHGFPASALPSTDACCNACYGAPNCFAFLYLAANVEGGKAEGRIYGMESTGNANATLMPGRGMCPAGEHFDRGEGRVEGGGGGVEWV